MIGVWSFDDKIKVVCTNERVSPASIKDIIKRIKRVAINSDLPCNVLISSFDDINFTYKGKLFYKKLINSNILKKSDLIITFEKDLLN